jgi:hypothetical protein
LIIYTPLPLELVLDGYDSYQPEYLELDFRSGKLIVEMISATEGRLVRLISPCPADYLDPSLQPGTVIPLQLAPKP